MSYKLDMEEISDRYSPKDVEARIYKWWESSDFFSAQDQSTKPPFSIILPPPNVTGHLHIGHALDVSIQDMLIRWKRMKGFNALWMPGTDHAGIATQTVVERELKKNNINRKDLGREGFLEKVWEWKAQYGNRIYDQMRRMGTSCDWKRAVFTLDEGVSQAVKKVFVDLYKRGLIYKGKRLVNWSWPLETAISDLEVEYKETKGTLYHIDYAIEKSETKLTVATTRPETLLGDSALAVHPDDERYRDLVGKFALLPLTGRKIPIIADSMVEKDFGTGVVKITPAHDFRDYQVGLRHKLEFINILNKDGTLNEAGGDFKGLKVQEARKQILVALKDKGLLAKEEPYKNSVGYCSRSGAVVEPMLSEQWFVRTKSLATQARHVVESGTIKFVPDSWTKTYLHWLSIIEDWCISRQLWWGHRIPAWTCDKGHLSVSETNLSVCPECGSKTLEQDPDVLDTWFSSSLWPFSTMGWPQETETQRTFYPTSLLVTAHDIIFFWVARMIMMGLEFKRDVPFRAVFIHGLIRDSEGKKMSKSANNSVDPVELIEEYGADALRFALLSQINTGRDLKFSESRVESARNFMNKIWNATRFSLGVLGDLKSTETPKAGDLSLADQWIISKLNHVTKIVDSLLEEYRFSEAANQLYAFVWNDFCDWYLELIKTTVYTNDSSEKQATLWVLAQVLNRTMRLLHPFVPFITEELYQKLPVKSEALITASYPNLRADKDFSSFASEEAAFELELTKECISAIRNIRGENLIKPGEQILARLVPYEAQSQKILGAQKQLICKLARLSECEIVEKANLQKCAVTPVRMGNCSVDVVVPLEGLVNIGDEVRRLKKNLEKHQKDMQLINNKLLNDSYIKNAPEDLVLADRNQLLSIQGQIQKIEEALARLN